VPPLNADPLGSAAEGKTMLLSDPWFWAFLGASGWALAPCIVATRTLGRHLWFGIAVLALAEIPRIILPLPFVAQTRIEPVPPFLFWAGLAILLGSLAFAAPVFRIVPLTRPDRGEPLRTDGLYSVVRHPLMLCDAFWPLGLSLMFGSVIGVLLTPVWFLVCWAFTYIEEDVLVREYGDAYRDLQSRVPRIVPRIPLLQHGRRAA
jgi:protein-S-isoprenylcysteine O-methyltransferase Ste14